MSTLIAGPWSGEFGWELFAWQAYVRSLSENFDKTKIICRKNSEYLYSDFANEFITCEPKTGLADSFFMHGFEQNKKLKSLFSDGVIKKEPSLTIFMPRRIGWPPLTHYSEDFLFGKFTIRPKYVIFKGIPNIEKFDYVFHARNRQLRSEDNWDIKNWEKLSKLLGKKIACIGTKKESHHISETTDLRDISLDKLCAIMHNSICVFGPSSGPMHLSSLCATPHIVWSKSDNRIRYENNWNPHKTPVKFLDEYGWHPSAEYIYESFNSWRL